MLAFAWELYRGRIHRLGSAKIADRIVVLDAGRIVETGTHEELMERKGYYYEMYQDQAKWHEQINDITIIK